MAIITLAGESLIAQKQGAQQALQIVRFIFANVPGLNPQAPIDRAAGKPPAGQIVHTYTIPPTNIGYVNPNQVVYSSMLGSDIGDFDFNWIGLESADGVLFAVGYLPLQQKRRNIPPAQIGNNITRNILVEFNGAQALTGISIDASTWQHDFTVRLAGIDERERLSNRDIYGRAAFFQDALQVTKVGASYRVNTGLAYIEGVRVAAGMPLTLAITELPTTLWLDVVLQRQLNDVTATWRVVSAQSRPDYTDSLGVQHYCIPLADLSAGGITDRRTAEAINGALIHHFAAQAGTYPMLRAQATTKEDVDLGNLPNAISDDPATNSSQVLATTRAVQGVNTRVNALIEGSQPAGNAHQLTTARTISLNGAATGTVYFDGSGNVMLPVTLAKIGIAPGYYSKVYVTPEGLVGDGQPLEAGDIPTLPWSKIGGGKPTTLAGYGITDALKVGETVLQRPSLAAPVPGSGLDGGALEIREVQKAANGAVLPSYSPGILFHWAGVASGLLAMDTEAVLSWQGKRIWDAGSFNPNSKADRGTTLGSYGITDAIKRGDYGLASTTAALGAVDTIGLPGGFHSVADQVNSLGNYCSVLNMPYLTGGYAGQLALQQGGNVTRVLARSVNSAGGWTPTVELYHTGNFSPDDVIPAGTLVQSFSPSPPAGCLRTNGAAVSRVAYARLFATIGTVYGAGDGVSTFQLPDTRGLFIRDIDGGAGRDSGRWLATVQESQNAWHTHTASTAEAGAHYHPGSSIANAGEHSHTSPRSQNSDIGVGGPNYTTAYGAGGTTAATNPAGEHSHGLTITADGTHAHAVTVVGAGGSEARPANMATFFYIKF